jgi:hypothetical protein
VETCRDPGHSAPLRSGMTRTPFMVSITFGEAAKVVTLER